MSVPFTEEFSSMDVICDQVSTRVFGPNDIYFGYFIATKDEKYYTVFEVVNYEGRYYKLPIQHSGYKINKRLNPLDKITTIDYTPDEDDNITETVRPSWKMHKRILFEKTFPCFSRA